jgi:hypothetical protein
VRSEEGEVEESEEWGKLGVEEREEGVDFAPLGRHC